MKNKTGFIIVIFMLAVFGIAFTACGNSEPAPSPIITYQYNIDLDLQKGIQDKFENGSISLPSVAVDTLTNGIVTDTKPYTGEITLAQNDFVYYSSGHFYLRDYSVHEFSITAALTLSRIAGDNGSSTVQFSFPIKKLHIPVIAIEIRIDVRGILYGSDYGAGAVSLDAICSPANASYKDVEYFIEYVVCDGVKVSTNIENYAKIDETGCLILAEAGTALKVGDKIAVKARAIKDNAESQIREVEVIKIPVESVRLGLSSLEVLGEGVDAFYDFNYSFYQFNPHIFLNITPWNATFRDDFIITIVNPDECPFASFGDDEYGFTSLLIDAETFIKYKVLEFYITIDGVQSNTCRVYIY